jgi:hypothetical protein
MQEDKNLLAFSGGGIRAATFALGALEGIRKEKAADIFNHVSAISGGGLTLAALICWFRSKQDDINANPLTADDETFDAFKESVIKRMLKKGLWQDIIWHWKFFLGSLILLLFSTTIYCLIDRFVCGNVGALSVMMIMHTAIWQTLYVFMIFSSLAVIMRTKCIKYWCMALCGLCLIVLFFFLEPTYFNVEPWFLSDKLNLMGCINMVLWRILIGAIVIFFGLIFLPLSQNKRDAIEKILKKIHSDTAKGKTALNLKYSDLNKKYKNLKPIISATNIIKNRLVIFKDDEIFQIGQRKYPWKNKEKLDNIATVANFTCNFPCAFSPSEVQLDKSDKDSKLNLLDGGILDNLGLWGPLFSSNIHEPFKKVFSIDAGSSGKDFKSKVWLSILFKLIGSGVSRIESITVQLAAIRNHLMWPDKNLSGFYFGHVDMCDDNIDGIIKGLYEAWMRHYKTKNTKVEIRDGLSWVDDAHIKSVLKMKQSDKIDVKLFEWDNFLEKVKNVIQLDQLYKDVYKNPDIKVSSKKKDKPKEELLFDQDVEIVNCIGVNLGPLTDKEINAGIRLARIFTQVVLRVYIQI